MRALADASVRQGARPRSLVAANLLSWIAAILAALAAVAGLLVDGLYRDAPYWVQQARGTDLATLLLAVPATLAGLWLARSGSAAGRLVVIGGLLYLIYNYSIYAFDVAFNALALLYIALLGLSVWSVALTLVDFAGEPLGRWSLAKLPRRLTAIALIAIAILFGFLWLSQIVSATLTGSVPADIVRAGLPTNPVYALDLALFLPTCVAAGLGLWRRSAIAAAFALPMLLWLAYTSAGIVGGFWFTGAAGDDVPLAVVVLVGAIGIGTAALAASAALRRAEPA